MYKILDIICIVRFIRKKNSSGKKKKNVVEHDPTDPARDNLSQHGFTIEEGGDKTNEIIKEKTDTVCDLS